MLDLYQLQKKVYQNKLKKGFNVTDIFKEIELTRGELDELFEACDCNGDIETELADVVIYILGMAEILGVNLEKALIKKVEINEARKYVLKDGNYVKVS